MSLSNSYLEFISERLTLLGKVSIRRMFGGAGVMAPARGEDKPPMFGIIDDDELFFKADESNIEDYTSRGLKRWTYSKSGKAMPMPYYPVPANVLEDDELLEAWGKKAMAVARKTKKRP
jgi:DNA transformation protein